jgi:hypothetical protein
MTNTGVCTDTQHASWKSAPQTKRYKLHLNVPKRKRNSVTLLAKGLSLDDGRVGRNML